MRPRFFLLSGARDPALQDHVGARLSPWLPRCSRRRDCILLTAADTPLIDMPAIDGWLVGHVFDAAGRARMSDLPSDQQRAAQSSCGEQLLRSMSGSYVAMWRHPVSALLTVLRDPSACQPTYWFRCDGLTVIVSDVDLLWKSGLVRPVFDADGIAQFLRFPHMPAARTGLDGIHEILPGERLTFSATPERTQLWQPWVHARHDRQDVTMVARAIDAVVEGQASGHVRVGLELSGGLDSSIVADALHRTGARCIGYNLVPDASDGDERRYARCVAARYDIQLIELPLTSADMNPLAGPTRMTARPTGVSYMRNVDQRFRAAQEHSSVPVVFSGGGGDSVFCSISSTAPILDAWRDGGWKLSSDAASDVAMITETTGWAVARAVTRRWVRDLVRSWQWPADDHLLDRRCRPAPDPHPWLDLPPDVGPGTRGHIVSLLRIQTVLDAHDRMADGPMFFPLLSQPVMEACLGIPSWQWMAGGRDRSAARLAFAGRVPDLVLDRRGKGRLDTLTVRAFDRCRAELRETLAGGWLAQNGLVDGEAIARVLASPVLARSKDYPRILALADAELWARAVNGWAGEARTG